MQFHNTTILKFSRYAYVRILGRKFQSYDSIFFPQEGHGHFNPKWRGYWSGYGNGDVMQIATQDSRSRRWFLNCLNGGGEIPWAGEAGPSTENAGSSARSPLATRSLILGGINFTHLWRIRGRLTKRYTEMEEAFEIDKLTKTQIGSLLMSPLPVKTLQAIHNAGKVKDEMLITMLEEALLLLQEKDEETRRIKNRFMCARTNIKRSARTLVTRPQRQKRYELQAAVQRQRYEEEVLILEAHIEADDFRGLVLAPLKNDLTKHGQEKLRKKALAVSNFYKQCLRNGGKKMDAYEEAGQILPGVSKWSVMRYVSEYEWNGGFTESLIGRHVRTTIFSNPHVMTAAKQWLEKHMFRKQQDGMWFQAEHFQQWLNKVLLSSDNVRSEMRDLRSYPIPIETVRGWLHNVFQFEYRENAKGIGHFGHEKPDVVKERMQFVFDCKESELQQFLWHQAPVSSLGDQDVLLQQAVEVECLMKKSEEGYELSLKEEELIHNVHRYEDNGIEMVEHHVDYLVMEERERLYPYFGGSPSIRRDREKFMYLACGQDEVAFTQYDQPKKGWYKKGQTKLDRKIKGRGGKGGMFSVVKGYFWGCGASHLLEDPHQSTNESELLKKWKAVRGPVNGAGEPWLYDNPCLVWFEHGG